MKIHELISAMALVGSFACGAAASIDFKAFLARVPPLPASGAAAAQAYPAPRGDLMPEVPAPVAQLQQELAAAQLQATAPVPGTTPGSAIDPAQAQAMAQKLQSMSQQEQIAYAMQMQAQLAPHPAVGVVSDAQGQAMKQLSHEQETLAFDSQKTAQTHMAHEQFFADWDQRDTQLSTQNAQMESGFEGSNADFVCSEAERAHRIKGISLHQKLAADELVQAAKISAAQRAYTDGAIARYQRVSTLATQVGPMMSAANGIQVLATSDTSTAIAELVGFNADAGRRAAHWQLMAAQLPRMKVQSCETGG